ncbi:MAG: NADH-quinone oxidoreductase subunit NuoE [Dethiobacteria bacterium]
MSEKTEHILQKFEKNPHELIPILQAVQAARGYLPKKSMPLIARYIGVPESRIYGVATFYAQFYLEPRGRHKIKACCGTACHIRGSDQIMEALEKQLGVYCGQTTPDDQYSLERVVCVGSCALAPVVMIDNKVYGRLESKKIKGVLDKYAAEI